MKRAIKKSDRIRNRESVNVAKNANMNNVGQTKSSSKNVQENSKNTEKQKKSNEKTKKKSSSVKK